MSDHSMSRKAAEAATEEARAVISKHMAQLDATLEKSGGKDLNPVVTFLLGIYTGAIVTADLGLTQADLRQGERAYASCGGHGRDQRDPKELQILFGSYVLARDERLREAADCERRLWI